MKRIDHNNYEAWLLDRLEGNLSEEEARQLDAFLLVNPELDRGSDQLPRVDCVKEGLTSLEKTSLRRDLPPTGRLDATTIDDFLVARLEGDLSPKRTKELFKHLQEHPEYQRAERLYDLTRTSVERVEFPRHGLKRKLPPAGMPTKHTLDDFLVARMEGELSLEQDAALDEYMVTDPEAERSWALMQLTRTHPEPLRFIGKDELKKGGKVIMIGSARSRWTVGLRVAAMLALLFVAGLWLLDQGPGSSGLVEVNGDPRIERTVPEKTTDDGEAMGSTDLAPSTPDPGTTGSGPAARAVPDERIGDRGNDEFPGRGTSSIDRDGSLAYVQTRMVLPGTSEPYRELAWPTAVGSEQVREPVQEHHAGNAEQGATWLGFLLGELRKEVLDTDKEDTRPLDLDDAVAVVDKGLRDLAGQNAGLTMARNERSGMRSFDLRFGRNLAISAAR